MLMFMKTQIYRIESGARRSTHHLLLGIILVSSFSVGAFASNDFSDYQRSTEVPEPLFIDLVRSLDSKAGEFEVNSLFSHSRGGFGELEWAPEVEWAFRDGSALEFELPMMGSEVENYKMAVQHTLNRHSDRPERWGLQAVTEQNTSWSKNKSTLYLIYARRFDFRWAILTMAGPVYESVEGENIGISFNQNVFYNFTREVDFGLEFNALSLASTRQWQLLPQLHLTLSRAAKIQFGFGAVRPHQGRELEPLAAFRLIYESNIE